MQRDQEKESTPYKDPSEEVLEGLDNLLESTSGEENEKPNEEDGTLKEEVKRFKLQVLKESHEQNMLDRKQARKIKWLKFYFGTIASIIAVIVGISLMIWTEELFIGGTFFAGGLAFFGVSLSEKWISFFKKK